MMISRRTLRRSQPANLLRLANWLKLRTEGMSHRQISKLVYWRITRYTRSLDRHNLYGAWR
jgi:hypothetical protein